jgi:hypothetical protein
MGNLPSIWASSSTPLEYQRNKHKDSVSIKLSCADFGTFNGRSDHWITFKENTLSKAGVGGYAQYFKEGFIETDANRERKNRIFYLLQTATNGGGASHIVRKHSAGANGHAAWQALLAWYEGPVMSGEIAKTLRTKLWALRLRSKDDVNKHVSDFTLYMDQLRELGREEREETLTDLFLDSIIDPKFEVTVANCRLRDRISIHECFEAIRKYNNVITRKMTQGEGERYKIQRTNNNIKQVSKHPGKKLDGSYRPYNEWQKLTSEQRAAILEARGKEKIEGKIEPEAGNDVETNTAGTEGESKRRQRERKRTRRQVSTGETNMQGDKEDGPEEKDPL